MTSPLSLVLVTVDCLRADHVGFGGYPRPTTPFLDSLARESLVFPAAIVAGTPTYYSLPAILASRYPLALGRAVIGLAPGEPTLASVLRAAGYATAAFCAGNPYLSHHFGYDAGFHTFRDFLDSADDLAGEPRTTSPNRLCTRLNRGLTGLCGHLGPVRSLYNELYFQYCQRVASPESSPSKLRRFPSAETIVDHAQDWLAGVTGPFFLWLHLMDPHSPYCPPAQALQAMGHRFDSFQMRYMNSCWNREGLSPQRIQRYRDPIIALYDAGIRWVDTQLARLTEVLRRFGLWDDCAFVVTADHGEQFLDHGGRYHPPRLNEELIRVPLLLRAPGAAHAALPPEPFSLLHLAPTLLDMLGVPIPREFCGRSHWPEVKGGKSWSGQAVIECVAGCTNPFHSQKRLGPRILAIRESRHKLVMDFGARREDLFDLEADAAELHPLPDHAERAIRRRLLERARQHLAEAAATANSPLRLAADLRDLRRDWGPAVSSTVPTKERELRGTA